MAWDLTKAKQDLMTAFDNNSEKELLKVLKSNSFLFYHLYHRKHGALPNFCEVSFGGKLRCDFLWLNDNSSGPEWVLIEIEKPKMKLFSENGDPSFELNHAIEQINSWDRYFSEYPHEKKRIFGGVAKFRYILVGGEIDSWETEHARKWRIHQNANNKIEIRSSDVFVRAMKAIEESNSDFWSFEENPVSLKESQLDDFIRDYGYLDSWKQIL